MPCDFPLGCNGTYCIECNYGCKWGGRHNHTCAECCIMRKRAPAPEEFLYTIFCTPCVTNGASGMPPLTHWSGLKQHHDEIDQRTAVYCAMNRLVESPLMHVDRRWGHPHANARVERGRC